MTAVPNFEFACVGARVLDVATALLEVLVRDRPKWSLACAFLDGYGPLGKDERAALPSAAVLRQAAVGVWSVGQVSMPAAHVRARLSALPEVRRWPDASATDLLRLVSSALP